MGDTVRNDWDIRCLIAPGVDPSFIRSLQSYKTIECVSGDITRPPSLGPALAGVDLVFHIAGIIHPAGSSEFYDVNARGTENLVSASLEAKVRRFVYV